ncbi:hypothetical protein [Azohydromonas lata]|uniref:Uncharacterized protein n=1 Tax=Azohydromonas lata TaxID=45677 RepID=A0ABU5IDC8_9BURK|nr:hypothetical protein [Azohydromonas lata]MDZ5457112.1 hypothetical protein [Azohydromonas lata]
MNIMTQRQLLAIALACSAFLGACGGGSDLQQENAAQTESVSAVAANSGTQQTTEAAKELFASSSLTASAISASTSTASTSTSTAESSTVSASISAAETDTEDSSIRYGADDFAQLPELDPLTFVRQQYSDGSYLASADYAAASTVKWNPGHYVEYGSKASDFMIDAGLRETASMPFVKGIMVRANWSQLEKGKGEYDFSRVDRYLTKAKAKGKRLFLTLGTKTFNGDAAIPNYMRTDQYSGGAFRIGTIIGTFGENAALYDDEVRDRLIALVQALGRRYNNDNSFEGITFNETAFGQLVRPMSDAQKEKFFANLAKVDTAARQAFPNSVVIQFINYPSNLVPPLFANMKDKGVGMGGPDVFINDPDLNKSAYRFNPEAKGIVPIGMKVESDCYNAVRHGGPYTQVDVRDIYRFARDKLYANYMFWYRYTDRHNPWQDVLSMFKGEAFPDGGAGGLSAACPSKFGNCAARLP